MDTHILAYLAGAIDSDGSISIKKSTYGIRVRGDMFNATYSERVMLKHVTPQVPQLLKDCFGGNFYLTKPQTENSKPMYSFQCTDKNASTACQLLLPYLRVKHRQAELVLELRESKRGKYWQSAYWFLQEFPNWQEMELVTNKEASRMLGYIHPGNITQAIRLGTLLALPYAHDGKEIPRIPKLLVERVMRQAGKDGRARNQAPELVAWRERLYQEIKELNKIGVNGTTIYHRTGYHTPK